MTYLSSYLGEISETATDRLFNKILGVNHVMVRPVNEFLSEEHSLWARSHATKQSPRGPADFCCLGQTVCFSFGVYRIDGALILEWSLKEILCKSYTLCSSQVMTVSSEPKVYLCSKVNDISLEKRNLENILVRYMII